MSIRKKKGGFSGCREMNFTFLPRCLCLNYILSASAFFLVAVLGKKEDHLHHGRKDIESLDIYITKKSNRKKITLKFFYPNQPLLIFVCILS